jgi:VanZ family protein
MLGGLLAGSIAVGSLVPGTNDNDFDMSDKFVHALAYFVLMFWFSGIWRRERHWILAIAIFAFGVAIELAQGITPSRSLELADAAANAGGILLALVLARFLPEGWCRRVEQYIFS